MLRSVSVPARSAAGLDVDEPQLEPRPVGDRPASSGPEVQGQAVRREGFRLGNPAADHPDAARPLDHGALQDDPENPLRESGLVHGQAPTSANTRAPARGTAATT